MSINCIVVDDEAIARKGIERYIKELDFLDLKGVCKNAMQANTLLKEYDIDLIFLDIEMPMISGIDFLKSLKNAPKVIFTTAYSEHAIDSFEFDVIDYLIKPISFEKFLQAANKAYRLIIQENKVEDTPNQPEPTEDYIFVKVDKQLIKVSFSEILYIQGMQNYVTIYTKTDKLLTLVPLKKIHEMLPGNYFVQTHKSYIVSVKQVEAIMGNMIMIEKHSIPISRNFKDEVMKALVDGKILRK